MKSKPFDSTILNNALTLLGAILKRNKNPEISIIVCGGSSLISNKLISRTTNDVDVVAFLGEGKKIIKAEPFPQFLKTAVESVQKELQLPVDWLNNGPWSIVNDNLLNNGLPEGFQDRLIGKKYGPSLNVYFISRLDQIYFKLYASADKGGPSYHLDDLKQLNPSDDEIYKAAIWSLTQDPSPEFHEIMIEMLKAIDYEYIAERI
jgi:hypothetical protein